MEVNHNLPCNCKSLFDRQRHAVFRHLTDIFLLYLYSLSLVVRASSMPAIPFILACGDNCSRVSLARDTPCHPYW